MPIIRQPTPYPSASKSSIFYFWPSILKSLLIPPALSRSLSQCYISILLRPWPEGAGRK